MEMLSTLYSVCSFSKTMCFSSHKNDLVPGMIIVVKKQLFNKQVQRSLINCLLQVSSSDHRGKVADPGIAILN